MSLRIAKVLTSDKLELCLPEVDVTFSAAPAFASKVVQNGTNGKITITSIKGQDIGNATSITITATTNAAAASVSGFDLTVNISGTNTTAAAVKTLIEANTNATALVSVATNTAGDLAAASKAFLTGGDDKMSIVSSSGLASIVHDSAGTFTLTLRDKLFGSFTGMCDVVGASSLSNVAKVEVKRVDEDTLTVRMADFAGSLVDPSAACSLKGIIIGQQRGSTIP